jgi:hypothetical protein
MGKIRKFAELNIRKIVGGKDPVRVVEDFIVRRGFEPSKCLKEKDLDQTRWMIRIKDEEDLEILVESARKPQETTIYMGVNIITVPIRGSHDVLAAALEIADGLVGIKVSLVGHYLVLSASMSAQGVTIDELDYNFRLIEAQQTWFRDALATELQWDQFPLD